MSGQGTTSMVLRSLRHLRAPIKGSKFGNRMPSQAAHQPKFVQPKDRVPFWNIVPGDHVRLRTGRVGETQGLDGKEKIRGEGVVLSVDREKNWLWLRDVDEKNQLAPKALRHITPRLLDPSAAEKGYGPNVTNIPRPVHYSNVMLKIPGTETFAVRLSRSAARYNRRKGIWTWKRYATVRVSDDKLLESGKPYEKVEVPWPSVPAKRRHRGPDMADVHAVDSETWAPWRPEDPVLLPPARGTTSVQSELRADLALAERMELDAAKARAAGPSATPANALGTYAGFKPGRVKPPPIAQPPTPAETLREQKESSADWASGPAIQAHHQEGGLSFMYSDYLDVAPRYGPAHSLTLPSSTPSNRASTTDNIRNQHTGKLLHPPSPNDLDRMPIELLMHNDLANPRGLKWRMRRWKQNKLQQAADQHLVNKADAELLKELEVLKIK
ncbi:hypothetical protein BCV70DRAFT_201465 [Testicularia cyperi]|uniref:KOW domain-containing protein n=1 Tax=Testicularia cyperi TaxID=1882483 RepID=A0A317XK59_9BASI|nr:hypothetical protein BCV70DRAFT_201465 [Testicularia cyperi]